MLVRRRHQEIFMFWGIALRKGFKSCASHEPISRGVKRKEGRPHINHKVAHITVLEGKNTNDLEYEMMDCSVSSVTEDELMEISENVYTSIKMYYTTCMQKCQPRAYFS